MFSRIKNIKQKKYNELGMKRVEVAQQAYETGNVYVALRTLNTVLEFDAENTEAILSLAMIHDQLQDDLALSHYKKFHKINSDPSFQYIYSDALKAKGNRALKNFEFQLAISYFKQAAENDDRPETLDALIDAYNTWADNEVKFILIADKVYKSKKYKRIDQTPENYNKKIVYETLQHLIKDNNKNQISPLVVRRALTKGNILGDVMWLKRGIKEPNLEKGKLHELEMQLRNLVGYWIDNNSQFNYLETTCGPLLSATQNWDAIDKLNVHISNDYTNAVLYRLRAKQYYAQRNSSPEYLLNAFHDAKRYTMLLPKDASGHYDCAFYLVEMGKSDEALSFISEAIKLDPANDAYKELKSKLDSQINPILQPLDNAGNNQNNTVRLIKTLNGTSSVRNQILLFGSSENKKRFLDVNVKPTLNNSMK